MITRLLLPLCSIALCFGLAELSMRALLYVQEKSPESVQEALQQSEKDNHSKLNNPTSLRGLVRPSANPERVYELKPSIHGLFLGKDYKINSLGFRGEEIAPLKKDGVKRILGLGDSIMFGWGVAQSDTYLSQLEHIASDHSKKIETINLAIPGYNTWMEAALLKEKAHLYAPDVIVLHFVKNDLEVPHFMRRSRDLTSLDQSFFIDFVMQRVSQTYVAREKSLHNTTLRRIEGKEKWDVRDKYRHMAGEKSFAVAMSDIREIADSLGAEVVVVAGGLPKQLEKLLESEVARNKFTLTYVKPYVDTLLKEHGVEDSVEARKKALWVSDVDSHPNALGHTAYALALYEAMRAIL